MTTTTKPLSVGELNQQLQTQVDNLITKGGSTNTRDYLLGLVTCQWLVEQGYTRTQPDFWIREQNWEQDKSFITTDKGVVTLFSPEPNNPDNLVTPDYFPHQVV